MEINEKVLLERASAGDTSAFNELMTQHEQKMYAVALRMCANREDAQDCLQEAMLRVYRAIAGFKGQSNFSTWLYRITMNTCLDELRRKKKKQNTSLDGLLDQGWMPSDEGIGPEKQALMHELRTKMSGAIQELPEEMRLAVVLRDVQGFSYDEVAQMTEVSVGTVKSRISRGREKLREKLKEYLELYDR